MALYPRLDDLLELRHQAHTLGAASHHLVNTSFSGLYASVFRGTGLDFQEVREYQAGDDVRNMDWKVTARTNNPHLKVFREERERNVLLCVDQGPHMRFGTRRTFKSIQAARAAALLGWAANSLNDRVGGLLFGNNENAVDYFRPTKDRRALWRLLRALSRPEAPDEQSGDPLNDALRRAERGSATGSLVFLIADLNRDIQSLEATMGRICQRHTLVLIPVDDQVDRDMPNMGRVLFTDPTGALIEIDTGDTEGREAYRQAWRHSRRTLTGVANRLGMPLLPIDTGEDVHNALARGMRHCSRTRMLR